MMRSVVNNLFKLPRSAAMSSIRLPFGTKKNPHNTLVLKEIPNQIQGITKPKEDDVTIYYHKEIFPKVVKWLDEANIKDGDSLSSAMFNALRIKGLKETKRILKLAVTEKK